MTGTSDGANVSLDALSAHALCIVGEIPLRCSHDPASNVSLPERPDNDRDVSFHWK